MDMKGEMGVAPISVIGLKTPRAQVTPSQPKSNIPTRSRTRTRILLLLADFNYHNTAPAKGHTPLTLWVL
jgi:hypothetical protein